MGWRSRSEARPSRAYVPRLRALGCGIGWPSGQEAGLHRQAEIIAHCPVLESTSVVREADQMDVLDRERLVGCGQARGEAALVCTSHRHIGGGHVVLDDDPLHLV